MSWEQKETRRRCSAGSTKTTKGGLTQKTKLTRAANRKSGLVLPSLPRLLRCLALEAQQKTTVIRFISYGDGDVFYAIRRTLLDRNNHPSHSLAYQAKAAAPDVHRFNQVYQHGTRSQALGITTFRQAGEPRTTSRATSNKIGWRLLIVKWSKRRCSPKGEVTWTITLPRRQTPPLCPLRRTKPTAALGILRTHVRPTRVNKTLSIDSVHRH